MLLPLFACRWSGICGVRGRRVVAPDGTIKPGMDASELISLARDYIGAFRLNHAVLSGALLLRNGTKFSEATGKIVANFKKTRSFRLIIWGG